MTFKNFFYQARRWGAIISGTFATGGTYGTLAGMLAKVAFSMSEENSLLYVGLPVAIAVAIYAGPKMGRILGFDK